MSIEQEIENEARSLLLDVQKILEEKQEKIFDLGARNEILCDALRAMLEDYRTSGCPDPDCNVCKKSDQAERIAREALALL